METPLDSLGFLGAARHKIHRIHPHGHRDGPMTLDGSIKSFPPSSCLQGGNRQAPEVSREESENV